jgi:rod shape-determining protein MreD
MSVLTEKDREFLLPARPTFIAASLFAALVFDWLPWHGVWLVLRPDLVALTLLYWCTHKPYRIGIGTAWAVGILVDVADASLFGQHALAYVVLAFGGIVLHRRVQMFDLRQQTLQVLAMLSLSYAAYAMVHRQIHDYVPWPYFLGCLTTALMWAPLTLLLQALRRKQVESGSV